MALFVILQRILFNKFLFYKLVRKFAPFLMLFFLTIIISIHPEHPILGKISFVNLHMEYSSILRVNSRAMVLGNVILIFIFGIVLIVIKKKFFPPNPFDTWWCEIIDE